ncbi:MAG TPA: transcription termination/antitermination protein NusG [Spirochaetota bacterium]|nr:transcription termination/antitermination protein NusG [Spirochaetota bacterium]
MEHKWYIVHTQSGKEFEAKEGLKYLLKEKNMTKVSDVVVPTYKETVYRSGKKKQVEKKSFPGYIYVKMDYDKESADFVANAPYISAFIHQGEEKPRPLSEKEVKNIISKESDDDEFVSVQIDFDIGQKVLIIDGPFNNFSGTIKAIYPDKKKVCVNVEIFGRTTPVEIDYFKVKKN